MTQNSNTHDDTIDLKELFFSLIAQWKVIALCIILSLICALLYLRITPPTYSTDAMVLVEDTKGVGAAALLGGLNDALPGGMGKSPTDAEIEILNSRMILGQVIQDLHLDIQIKDQENTLLNRILKKSSSHIFYRNDSVIVEKDHTQFVVKKFEVPSFYIDKPLTINFKKNQQFEFSYDGEIVFTGQLNTLNQTNNANGQWKIEILNKTPFRQNFSITKLSIPSSINLVRSNYKITEKGKQSGVLGLSFIGQDKEHITQVLNRILEIYQTQNIERKSLESKQTLSFLDKQLPVLKQQLEESEIKFNRFREQYNTVDVTQESELMLKQNVELAKMKIELQQQQAELSSKYTNDHPLMVAINSQLAELDQKAAEMTQSIKHLPETQRLYLQLYRDVKVNTELYTGLLNSYQQLKIAKAGEIGNVRLIDHAIEPVQAFKPRSLFAIILSLFVGGFIGVLLALLRNLMQSGIKDSTQIENELGLPVYATVPRSPVQESRINILKKKKTIPILAVRNSEDIAVESLRSIRTAIHFALTNAKNNVIAISGPAPEVGKSFISINLATIFAQSNKRVLLLDMDLRRGYLHKYFNREVNSGITDIMNGNIQVNQAIYKTDIANLDFIPRGKSPNNPSEMLDSQQFKDLLNTLSEQYDHIILDTPPVLAVTDGIILAQYSGVNLVVARYAKTQLKELELTIAKFEQAGTKVNGIILNDVRAIPGSSGYNYSYAYGSHKDD